MLEYGDIKKRRRNVNEMVYLINFKGEERQRPNGKKLLILMLRNTRVDAYEDCIKLNRLLK